MHTVYYYRSEIWLVRLADEFLMRSIGLNRVRFPDLRFDGRQEGQQPGSAIMQNDGIRKLISRHFLCTFFKKQLKYAKG